MNSFAGISSPNVMIDNGCSTLLLPFPGEEALSPFANADHVWKIGGSRGTGPVNARTLTIKHALRSTIGTMTLADKAVMDLPGLRFHLTAASARAILDMGRIENPQSRQKLQRFVAQNHPGGERHHVLLDQMVLDSVVSVQSRGAFVIAEDGYIPSAADITRVHQVLSGIEKPEGFDDLEDDDHDGDETDWEDHDPFETLEFDDEPSE